MKTSRRLFALVAAFAVAFGALWPLVCAARPGPALPSLICTQGGFHAQPGAPAGDVDKFHCPLCVASMDAAVPEFPREAIDPVALEALVVAAPAPAFHAFLLARPPPARAPPPAS